MEMVSFLPRGRPDSNMTIFSVTLLQVQDLIEWLLSSWKKEVIMDSLEGFSIFSQRQATL